MFDLPDSINQKIAEERYELDRIGMSDSSILLFSDKVLKIRGDLLEAQNEVLAMQWLAGKLSVPEVIAHECSDGKSYLLMSKVSGRMACEEDFLSRPEQLTELLAQALKELWKVDVSACPLDWSLEKKLEAAKENVRNHLVDVENTEPDTFGPDGFADPEALLEWLVLHQPEEEPVLSHGDFCLPNLLVGEKEKVSFIDLGRTGVADKWQDIALCYRSLKHNYAGKYGGREYPGYAPDLLFEKLGIEPDWEKIKYYILLDELF